MGAPGLGWVERADLSGLNAVIPAVAGGADVPVAGLLAVGAVTLKRVAQEGIRARAGAASFRRGETLERCLEEARAPVEASKRQGEDDPGAVTRRQQAARARGPRAASAD